MHSGWLHNGLRVALQRDEFHVCYPPKISLPDGKMIAGAAHNQLATEDDGARLAERGILYAPDYVINASGVISVARAYLRQSSDDEVRKEVHRIPERLRAGFAEAEATIRPTNLVADELARHIAAGGGDNAVLDSATNLKFLRDSRQFCSVNAY